MDAEMRASSAFQALGGLAAGPGNFPQDADHFAVVSRTDGDSIVRLGYVMTTLGAPTKVLKALVERAKQASEIGWLIITHIDRGPWVVRALSNDNEAIVLGLSMCATYFEFRKLRWTALVVGAPEDVAAISVFNLNIKLPETSSQGESARVKLIQDERPRLIIEVPKADVLSSNLAGTLCAIDGFCTEKTMVEKLAGRVLLEFLGYDDDPRELFQIPETRRYLQDLLLDAPWLPLVCDRSMFSLWLAALDEDFFVEVDTHRRLRLTVSQEAMQHSSVLLMQGLDLLAHQSLMLDSTPEVLVDALKAWHEFLIENSVSTEGAKELAEKVSRARQEEPQRTPQAEQAQRTKTDDGGTSHEQRFWDEIGKLIGDRQVFDGSGRTATPKAATGEKMETFIYAMDTTTGVIAGIGFSEAEAESMCKKLKSHPLGAAGFAEMAIHRTLELGKKGAASTTEEISEAAMAAMGSLSWTATMDVIRKQTGGIKGHFVCFIYTEAKGTSLARPAYASNRNGSGPMSKHDLLMLATATIRKDLQLPTKVGKACLEHGGLVLFDELKRLVNN